MSQELHGVRVQFVLDQVVQVLPSGHSLGQQAPRSSLSRARRNLRGALAGNLVNDLRWLALFHRSWPIASR